MSRYHFEDFCWFPANNVDKALEHLQHKVPAIHMNDGIFSTDGLQKLLDNAKKAESLEALFLPCNNLGNEGCKLFGEYLKTDKHLRFLYLERNKISDEGVGYLLEGLLENTTLKTLMLGDNEIGNPGAVEFANYIKIAKGLKEFSIGSSFSEAGGFAIAKALNSNPNIEAVFLNNNEMNQLAANVLAEVVSRHPTCSNVQVSSRLVSASNFSEKLKRMTEEESKKAFEKAVTEDQEGPWMRSKIMVVGQGRAGKTATVRSLLGKPFDPKLDSTVGASISQSNTKSGGKNWQDTKDEKIDFTTDTAARLAALKLARKRNEDANQLENFSIEDTIKYYENKQKEEEHRATVQSRDGAVFDDEEITKRFNVQLVTNKKSGLDDINFTIWDYGGQTVFYTLHHLFLTRYGIYMLAFDMREVICLGKSPEEKSVTLAQTKEYLLFWLNSVYMHATEAPLMIIGTFLDAIEDSKMLQEVDRFIKKLTVGKFDQIVQNGGLSFFPLSNRAPQKDVTALLSPFRAKVGVNIEIIRDTIEEVARKEAFVTKPLSLRWIKTLDTMLEQEESCLTLDKVREIASACHVDKPGDIDKMLAFFHELGMIVHLTSTQNLRNIVTTKPQWLVDALSKVIRDSTLHGFNMQQVETSGLLQAYNLMLKKSLVTRDWLDFLWPKDRIDFLVDLMRRTMLISDWNFGEFESEAAYLVPSLIKIIKKEDMKIAAKYLIQFEQVEQEEDEDEDEDGVNVGRVDRPGGGLKRGLNMLRAGANMKEKQEKVKVIPRAEKLGVFIGEEREVLNKKTGKTEMIKDIHNYAFRTPNKVNSVVFDFRKSFLPNGVFQRLLCLCILKCTSSQMKIAVPPKLHKNSAEINMGDGQIFRLYQFELQIMCQVVKDEVRSYRMLRSMMSKLKADVMGTGLDWDVYFEYELPQETQKQFSKKKSKEKGSLHAFMALEEAKKAKIAPWYEEGQEKKIAEEAIDVGGIELEAFLTDLDGM